MDRQPGPAPFVAVTEPAVFAGIEESALLATGQFVDIAPAGPGDFERVRSFYERLGDTSTYYRFFGIRRALPDSELRNVVAQHVPTHVTLLASIGDELIGIGEFIIEDDPKEAEIAFAVADDHHREGVATLLLERLAIVGRRCGLDRFVATTLPGNADMQLVFRTVGLTEHSDIDDGVVDVTLDLSSLDGLTAQAAVRRRSAASRSFPPPKCDD